MATHVENPEKVGEFESYERNVGGNGEGWRILPTLNQVATCNMLTDRVEVIEVEPNQKTIISIDLECSRCHS